MPQSLQSRMETLIQDVGFVERAATLRAKDEGIGTSGGIHYGIVNLRDAHPSASIAPQIIAAGAGILLLVGLWTLVTGVVVALARCGSLSRVPVIHGFGSCWPPLAPLWQWSDREPGPSMPGSLVGSTSIFRNPRGIFISP
jgi:hypothetical protein